MCGLEREDWLIQLANHEGGWPGGHMRVFGQSWVCPERARDDYVRVISDQKWTLKERLVIAHIKARSKHSFLIINRNDLLTH